jgi:hypothetical protein
VCAFALSIAPVTLRDRPAPEPDDYNQQQPEDGELLVRRSGGSSHGLLGARIQAQTVHNCERASQNGLLLARCSCAAIVQDTSARTENPFDEQPSPDRTGYSVSRLPKWRRWRVHQDEA